MRHKVKNEVVDDKVGVTSIKVQMREAILGWFRNAKRRDLDASVIR